MVAVVFPHKYAQKFSLFNRLFHPLPYARSASGGYSPRRQIAKPHEQETKEIMPSYVETAQKEIPFLKELECLIGKAGEGGKTPQDSNKDELPYLLSYYEPFNK